jgi:simple sugar transport system ATP-binding protein
MSHPAIQLRGITKVFPGVVANRDIDLDFRRGEVHALLGENGAGKSTLMGILFGIYRPTEGAIVVDGEERVFSSPADAIKAGVGMVHQHFMLVPVFTVWENIVLGLEPLRRKVIVDRQQAVAAIRRLSKLYGMAVDPEQLVEELPVGVQQRVEILKALYGEAQCLILDEPSAVLTPGETQDLFEVIRALRAAGKTIIFISHKLNEVMEIADRITVLRRGEVVGTTTPAATSHRELANMMVGRDVAPVFYRNPLVGGRKVLTVSDRTIVDERDNVIIDHVSFDVHGGEIFGIAGVEGNGQSELIEGIAGLRAPGAGTIIRLDDADITGLGPAQLVELGVAHIPEDRQSVGLVGSLSVKKNLVLKSFAKPPFARGIRINRTATDELARGLVDEYDIRATSIDSTVSKLSGGNQQKVIVARELRLARRLLIASQPTRGLDVGAIQFIHTEILRLREKRVAIILVSTELDEVMALADRIGVMYEGQLVAIIPREKASVDRLGLLMTARTDSEPGTPSHDGRNVSVG